MKDSRQRLDFYEFGGRRLQDLLNLEQPPFVAEAFLQLFYIEDYLRDHSTPCRSVIIERHYIDRDYIEDHSVFYSRNLFNYPNSCQRLHFFSVDQRTVKRTLRQLTNIAATNGPESYRQACEKFSKDCYLGFAVIKPLNGCPVGRTVLKHYDDDAGKGYRRDFPCTREYHAHLAGIRLTVRGLAFQQQDIGVSACATTALWIALQKVRDFEDLGAATPAQITRLASQYTLPFGRSMPSEGLSIDQMCQAVQSLGVSPNLLRGTNYETARGYLYSACKSGFAQVLILENPSNRYEAHAITVAGMKFGKTTVRLAGTVLTDRASELVALYVHDDRIGPYLRADVIKTSAQELRLDVGYGFGENRRSKEWVLTHILIPMHGKIRLSFDELRLVATENLAAAVEAIRIYTTGHQFKGVEIVFETLIQRSVAYLETLFFAGETQLTSRSIQRIRTTVSLSRYLGVIRLSTPYFGSIDVLIDTTSTPRNINYLGIIVTKRGEHAELFGGNLAALLNCRYIA